jgi:hypothetical protein
MEKDNNLQKAVWSNAHMNDLPDSAFLDIESGGKKDESGKTVPRSLRHFPYKGMDGKIDLAHVRNAIARIPQSKAGLSEEQKTALQNRARKLLGGVNKMEKAMFYIDLEKGNPTGGKYKQRIPKPGGGYRYIYEDGQQGTGGNVSADKVYSEMVSKKLRQKEREHKKRSNRIASENENVKNRISNDPKVKAALKKWQAFQSSSSRSSSYRTEAKHARMAYLNAHQEATDRELGRYRKSMDEGTEILETFLKSTIEDNSLPVIGKGKEQGDQSLDGKGKSSGSPGNGSTVPDRGVAKPSVKKLSEDDEVDEANMKDRRKPIENTARKSLHIASQTHDYMAREVAIRKAQLTKEEMIRIEPDGLIQKSMDVQTLSSDEAAVRSMTDDTFYKAHLMNRPLFGIPLATVRKCSHCSNTFSKAITVCPNCGR